MFFYGYWNHQEQSAFSNVPMALHMPYYYFAPPPILVNILYPKSTLSQGLVANTPDNLPRVCIHQNSTLGNTINVDAPMAVFGTVSPIPSSDPAYPFVTQLQSTTITGKWVIKDAVAPKTPAASALPMSFTVDGVQCYALGNSKTSYTDTSDDAAIVNLYYPHNNLGYWQTHDFGYLTLNYSNNHFTNAQIAGGFTRFTDDNGRVLSSLIGKVIDFGDAITEIPLYFYEYISAIATPYSGVRLTIKSWDGVNTLASRVFTGPIRKVDFSDNFYDFNVRGVRVWTTTMADSTGSIPLRYEKPTDEKVFGGWSLSARTTNPEFAEGLVADVYLNSDTIIYESYYEQQESIDTMTINLYENTAESNRIDKTGYIKSVDVLKGTLRGACNILYPVITVQANKLPTANYMFIKELGNRWYFIHSWKIIATGLYELSASVDVLMTYKNEILDLECVIEKNEFERDPLLYDGSYVMYPDFELHYQDNPVSPFSGVTDFTSRSVNNVILVLGED